MPKTCSLAAGLCLAFTVVTAAKAQSERDPQRVPVPSGLMMSEAWARRQHDACAAGDSNACTRLALAYRVGRGGVMRDHDISVRLYARSWWLRGSREASIAIYEVMSNASEFDSATLQAVGLLCAHGAQNVCAARALYALRRALSRDEQRRALADFEATCENGASRACYDLGSETGYLPDVYPWYFARR